MKVFYSPEYVGAGYAFDTTRKSRWIADSLSVSPIEGIELARPEPLSQQQVEGTHDPKYVDAVRTGEPRHLAESQGFAWDAGLWSTVLASNGGVVEATFEALQTGLSGSLSSGLHHARRGHGAGFCTFNGLVIAARAAVSAGVESVLVLDLDAHCGGGTASLIADDAAVWQTDVSVCAFDAYQASTADSEAQRVRLRIVGYSADYLAEVEQALDETARAGPRFDLCLYNAGMDPYEGCSTGGLGGITGEILAARERLAFSWCREHATATAFVLAGGYVGWGLDEKGLVDLHRLTLSAAADAAGEGARRPASDSLEE